MNWQEIPRLIRGGHYEVNVGLNYLVDKLSEWEIDPGYMLQLNPDFQRGHVWTQSQQEKFVEYFLSGGVSGRVIFFNKPSWSANAKTDYDDFVCVDGLQRITALAKFMKGEIKAFNQDVSEFGGRVRLSPSVDNLRFNINDLQTKKEVLAWYLQMNSGGTAHTTEELNKVKAMLKEPKK